MGIGERIKARRRELGYSAEMLAERTGLSPATIYRYESSDIANMRTDKLRPIALALSTTPAALMGWEEGAAPEDMDALRSEFTLRVEDGSMAPRLVHGDIVYLRRQDDVAEGEIAAVEYCGRTLLRRIYRVGRGVQLIAENPEYPPLILEGEACAQLCILGRAAAFKRRL
ncbi:MAG: helix-turn-helix domain-containing protein [Clostridia bacterium]|nr:helix-turn-helix domain-containing protein [Clostridia bacterium]